MRVLLTRRDADRPEIELTHARGGLGPYWSKEEKPRGRFNAKYDTAATNGVWREAFSHARCLFPALGWYEWCKEDLIDKATGELGEGQSALLHVSQGPPPDLLLRSHVPVQRLWWA